MWESAISARDLLLQEQDRPRAFPGSFGAAGPNNLWEVGGDAGEALGINQREQLLHMSAGPHMASSLKEEGGGAALWIRPAPQFVIKARLQRGQKLFLNICSHPQIEPWHYKEVLSEEGQGPQGGVRIPMSIGPCPFAQFLRRAETPILLAYS